jgi:hypothetical protein
MTDAFPKLIPNMQEKNSATKSDISNLQDIEKGLFDSLEKGDAFLTTEQKNEIVNKINEVSQMRINLYNTLDKTVTFYDNNVNSVKTTLDEESKTLDIVERELSEAKKRLLLIEEEKNNKLRLVEINNYYSDKYSDQVDMLKTVVYTCIPIVILVLLNKYITMPRIVYITLLFVVLTIGCYVLSMQMYRYTLHDNMSYQERNWDFNINDKNLNNAGISLDPWGIGMGGITCSGTNCCDTIPGYAYNATANKCLPNQADSSVNQANSIAQNSSSVNGSMSDIAGDDSDYTNELFSQGSNAFNYLANESSQVSKAASSYFVNDTTTNPVTA